MVKQLNNDRSPTLYAIINLVRTQNFPKTNISYPPIRTRTCAYQGVRSIGFAENFAYVLNG